MVTDLPPQITFECRGTAAGTLRRTRPFSFIIYVDIIKRRFVTEAVVKADVPTAGEISSISSEKIILWDLQQENHPGRSYNAEVSLQTYQYCGRFRMNAVGHIDERYLGVCTVKRGVPTSIQAVLKNAPNQ